jgi:hypothetical protein
VKNGVGGSSVTSEVVSIGEDSRVTIKVGEGDTSSVEKGVAVSISVIVGSIVAVYVGSGFKVAVKVAVAVDVGMSLIGVASWARDIAVNRHNNPPRTIFTESLNFHLCCDFEPQQK